MATKTHHDSEGINTDLNTNKISYYTNKILTYLNQPTAGVITQHDIYDLCTNMFSADIYLMNIFKKHPINTCYKFDNETTIKKFMSTVSDEMTWIVFLKYNIIICLNDPMISYIWPLRKILSETDNSFAPVNVIRLPFKCIFDNTEHIGPRLFITESPLAMFEYFPSNYEPSHFTYERTSGNSFRKLLVNNDIKHPRIKDFINKEIDDDNEYDYRHQNKELKTPFRDNNILESLSYFHRFD